MMPPRLLLRSEMCAEDQLQRNCEVKTTCQVLSAERLRAAGWSRRRPPGLGLRPLIVW
jgi:hypothetical protein